MIRSERKKYCRGENEAIICSLSILRNPTLELDLTESHASLRGVIYM